MHTRCALLLRASPLARPLSAQLPVAASASAAVRGYSSSADAAASFAVRRHLSAVQCMQSYHAAMNSRAPHCVAAGRALDVPEAVQGPALSMAAPPLRLMEMLQPSMEDMEMLEEEEEAIQAMAYPYFTVAYPAAAEMDPSAATGTTAAAAPALSSSPARATGIRAHSYANSPLLLDSVKRKRAKKMNRHKYKKRLRAQRQQSRKDTAQ